jgi:hypothetical protein
MIGMEKWRGKLEKCLQTDDRIVLLALGDVKYEVLNYLNKRKDVEILKLETRQVKKRDKGTGLKAAVRKPRQTEQSLDACAHFLRDFTWQSL